MTANATTRIGISKHLLGATVLAAQLALALVIYFFLRPHATEISLAAALISFTLPLAYLISAKRQSGFYASYPYWAVSGHLIFIVPALAFPQTFPMSGVFWALLVVSLALNVLVWHSRPKNSTDR